MSVKKITVGDKTVGIIDLEETFEEVKKLGISDENGRWEVINRLIQAKNYVPSGMAESYRTAILEEYRIITGEAQRQGPRPGTVEIRLYGTSCFNCEKLDEMVKDILSRNGVKADYLHVTDTREVAQAGIIQVPALVVNSTLVLQGRVPLVRELEDLLIRAIGKLA